MKRRDFLKTAALAAPALATPGLAAGPCLAQESFTGGAAKPAGPTKAAGETLYNGIALPPEWPPHYSVEQFSAEAVAERTTTAVPYLISPPRVIPIDVGRQLLVDDFLVEQTNLHRTYHRPVQHPDNPVLKPDRPWEQLSWGPWKRSKGGRPDIPTAMPFSDGVWYDPADSLFKMWYMAGYCKGTAYATSKDGIVWEKPALDVERWNGDATNLIMAEGRDSTAVWLDLDEQDPQRRYKMMVNSRAQSPRGGIRFSADGMHWSKPFGGCHTGDRTTVFFNPFRGVWVYSIRDDTRRLRPPMGAARIRRYREDRDVVALVTGERSGRGWLAKFPLWCRGDSLDPVTEYGFSRSQKDDDWPEVYNLDCVAYESLLLGLFAILPGLPNDASLRERGCSPRRVDGRGTR